MNAFPRRAVRLSLIATLGAAAPASAAGTIAPRSGVVPAFGLTGAPSATVAPLLSAPVSAASSVLATPALPLVPAASLAGPDDAAAAAAPNDGALLEASRLQAATADGAAGGEDLSRRTFDGSAETDAPAPFDMGAAMSVQLASLRPVAERLGTNVTVASLLASSLGVGASLADLVESARKLAIRRATVEETEAAVAHNVAGVRLRKRGDGRYETDDMANLFLAASRPEDLVEIYRNQFYFELDRAVRRSGTTGWTVDLSRASWARDGSRLLLFLGTARKGGASRPLAISFELGLTNVKDKASDLARTVAGWPGLDAASRAGATRVADELAAAGL